MARSRTKQRRVGKKLDRRPAKKRVCVFCSENIRWVDYKDADLLRRYMSERAKIRGRRVSGNCRFHQSQVATAIKLARELALLPYAQRQVTVRSKKPRADRPGQGGRAAGPMPEPASPPPPPRAREGEEGIEGVEGIEAEAVEGVEGIEAGEGIEAEAVVDVEEAGAEETLAEEPGAEEPGAEDES